MVLFKAIINFLIALPGLVKIATFVIKWLDKSSGQDIARFAEESAVAFKKLDEAKSKEDKADAAKTIAQLISTIPR